jgi:asparagine synthase (glutamine-hydrolysing)
MCGILGGFRVRPFAKEVISGTLDTLRHRGPDSAGLFQCEHGFLGIRRLAIIDLAGGQQPIFNEDRSVVVVLNGEIYNYVELMAELKTRGHVFRTASDTEVLVHLFEEFGTEMVNHLRGMFAFALWDLRTGTLLLARDRLGKKPLYYAWSEKLGLLFASEIKALRALAAADGRVFRISDQAIADYLSLAAVPQSETVYQEVRMLPPATLMVCTPEGISERSYWKLKVSYPPRMAYTELLERIRSEISLAVRLRTRSDVPVGIFLSSGIDSSIVAFEASRAVSSPLKTFTVQIDDQEFDESAEASTTAKLLGADHHCLRLVLAPIESLRFLVKHFDQPFADPSAIPSLEVSKLAREHVKVVLNGDGGDELFAGYRRHFAAASAERIKWLPGLFCSAVGNTMAEMSFRHRSSLGFIGRFLRGLGTDLPQRYLIWSTDMLNEQDKERWWRRGRITPTEQLIAAAWPHDQSMLRAQMFTDIRINLLNVLLVKMDMASMAASVEVRSPFLDHVVAEFAQTIPDHLLLSRGRTKAILRDAYAGRLSKKVLAGGKRGFEIPLERWLQTELRELLHDSVGNPHALIRTYLDDQLIDLLLEGKFLNRNQSFILYSLLVLELWLQDQRSPSAPVSSGLGAPLSSR